MCGISGYLSLTKPISGQKFYAAHRLLSHRGRDDEGFIVGSDPAAPFQYQAYSGDDTSPDARYLPHINTVSQGHLIIGHRRLSIIDLRQDSRQPMLSPTGRYAISFNGEIYNYLEIRKELANEFRFRTNSDTEVILAAYEKWGSECFAKFNGMWAIAIVDREGQKLMLSRDRFGVKPLYYTHNQDQFAFGSELKFLRALIDPGAINGHAVRCYLSSSMTDFNDDTFFDNIKSLPPGTHLTFDFKQATLSRYWSLSSTRNKLNFNEKKAQLEQLLESAVDLRLRSDVKVGCLLSGGLDSSVIAGLVLSDKFKMEAKNFICFSATTELKKFSEEKYVHDVEAKTGATIEFVRPDFRHLRDELPTLQRVQETPFRSLAVYFQYKLMEAVARSDTKVLLNGQGADEIFGGYTRHLNYAIGELATKMRLRQTLNLRRTMKNERSLSDRQIMMGFLRIVQATTFHQRQIQPTDASLFTINHRVPRPSGLIVPSLRSKLIFDHAISPLPEYLRYEDRNSMAFTLESRLPFMDYRIVEFALNLDVSDCIQGHSTKHILREAGREFIPHSVYARRDKMGFVTPQEQWQKNEMKDYLLELIAALPRHQFPYINWPDVDRRCTRYFSQNGSDWPFVWRMACLSLWTNTLLS